MLIPIKGYLIYIASRFCEMAVQRGTGRYGRAVPSCDGSKGGGTLVRRHPAGTVSVRKYA
jgi:hypothetical protein